jgi:hypothetical protein
MLRKLMLCAALGTAAVAVPAMAQSANGYGSIITIPVVVQTSTYSSAVFIHNYHPVPLLVKPDYVGADGSATVGAVSCAQVVVPAGQTAQYALTTLCPLNAGSNFGRLKLFEQNTDNRIFSAYSRVETFSGNGFSIEGFPIGNFSNAAFTTNGYSHVAGLRRQASAPGYQTNCFVASLNEAVDVSLELFTGANAPLGSLQIYSLAANQVIRVLDVFASVGAPAGDYSNVRAQFSENSAGTEPSFAAYCTVQNNTSFDADFRIAKTVDVGDARSLATTTTSFDSGVTADGAGNLIPALNSANAHVYGVFLQHPDFIRCTGSGVGGGSGLEVGLFDPFGTEVVDGNNSPSFGETYLGEKSSRNSGFNGRWTIRVEADGSGGGSVTDYTVTCTSGNGMAQPIYMGAGSDLM